MTRLFEAATFELAENRGLGSLQKSLMSKKLPRRVRNVKKLPRRVRIVKKLPRRVRIVLKLPRRVRNVQKMPCRTRKRPETTPQG